MTVPASRTITNSSDVGRKIPESALAQTQVKLTGPDAVGAAPANVIDLPERAARIICIQSTVTATGAAGAVLVPIAGTHYELIAAGTKLKNPSAVDFSAETWVIDYEREADQGGQSTVTP